MKSSSRCDRYPAGAGARRSRDGPDPPERRAHLRRRSGLRRCLGVRRDAAEDAEHRSPRPRRPPVHRRPLARRHLHALSLRDAHRRVCVAKARHRHPARQRRADHRAGPDHAGQRVSARRLRNRRRGQVAPRPRSRRRTGLERRDPARARPTSASTPLHHGRHRRPRAHRLRRESPRRRPRSGRSDQRELRPADRRLADRPRRIPNCSRFTRATATIRRSSTASAASAT